MFLCCLCFQQANLVYIDARRTGFLLCKTKPASYPETIQRAVHTFAKTLAGDHAGMRMNRKLNIVLVLANLFVSHAHSGCCFVCAVSPIDAVHAHSAMVDDSLLCHYDVYHVGRRPKDSTI